MKNHSKAVRGGTLAVSAVVALGASLAASAQIVPKELSGPPAEFSAMRAVDPVDATIHSHSALLGIDLVREKSGTLGWNGQLPVETDALRFALLGPDADRLEVSLASPDGRSLRAMEVAKHASASSFGMDQAQVPARMFRFDQPAKGSWQLNLRSRQKAGAPQRSFLLLEGSPDTELASHVSHTRQLVGQTLGVTARLSGTSSLGKALLDAEAGRITRASMTITGPDGAAHAAPMFDDGLNGDGQAGDGVFGGQFVAATPGSYTVQVMIEGVDRHGTSIVRTAEHLLPVLAPSIQLDGAHAVASRAKRSGERVTIRVPVSAAKSADHFRAYAEVWGYDASGTSVPVAWVGGMVAAKNGALELGLDERWVTLAGAQGPYELRNLRIEDPDHFVTLAQAERMSLDLPPVRSRTKARDIVVDETMTMGPRPDRLTAKGSGRRLLLVHGYCSGGVWPAGHFSTASAFLDQNQNRSHDAFARLIWSFGNQWNSYGVVAHSQGGAAALHLYTYYWSGFDNATGARLIQSVGTPYKGTNLAGILATLGNWFGVGCGSNSDLTYSGASAWLAGIPSWARSKVNYYTTSFNDRWWAWDYCNAATDLVLSDPEDGTTEKVNGQLPGAVNRGHTTGQCHTSSMRDPAQYLDYSRNATMNANAAR